MRILSVLLFTVASASATELDISKIEERAKVKTEKTITWAFPKDDAWGKVIRLTFDSNYDRAMTKSAKDRVELVRKDFHEKSDGAMAATDLKTVDEMLDQLPAFWAERDRRFRANPNVSVRAKDPERIGSSLVFNIQGGPDGFSIMMFKRTGPEAEFRAKQRAELERDGREAEGRAKANDTPRVKSRTGE